MRYLSWQPSKKESYLYIDQWFKEHGIILDNHFLVGDYDIDGIIISSFDSSELAIPNIFAATELTPVEVLELVKDQATGIINDDNSITFQLIEGSK